jgi:hypothetical protein
MVQIKTRRAGVMTKLLPGYRIFIAVVGIPVNLFVAGVIIVTIAGVCLVEAITGRPIMTRD